MASANTSIGSGRDRPDGSPIRDEGALQAEALELLRALTCREDAAFREGQFEAISALVAERRRTLVVERTGWGKSAVYFIAALLLRRRGLGPTLLVSPLLALMRDQVAAAERAGVRAAAINSANATEWGAIEARLSRDEIDVLLVSPERLNSPGFREAQLPELRERVGMLVVDEAHCISDWGHDFRPDYRRIGDLVRDLPADVPILATTATANARVVTDVEEQLGAGGAQVLTIRGPLARASLRLGVLSLLTMADRLGWLVEHLPELPGSGIVYTLTVSAAEDAARLLAEAGIPARAYTGRTDPDARVDAERELKENRVKALVATSALGMGFDKPDLGFVIHLGAPSSAVAYYQQVGRAGRATDRADALLLPGTEDAEIWEYFSTSSMPRERDARAVLDALAPTEHGDRPIRSTAALETAVDVTRTRLELLLKVLDVDGAVARVRGGWVGTGRPWTYDAERYARTAEARRREAEQMLAYEALGTPSGEAMCRMEFLARALDDPAAAPCGRCDVCAGAWYPRDVAGDRREMARTALDRTGVVIDARSMWPTGMDALGVVDSSGAPLRGRIPVDQQAEPGRAVARMTDLGWGGALRELFAVDAEGRPRDGRVPDALGRAIIDVLAQWPWERRPAAVVRIPSDSRPILIESLAEGIAATGRMRDLGALTAAPARGVPGANSAFRLRDVHGRFRVGAELAAGLAELDGAPILLVDDRAHSRWTLTEAARVLRAAGAGPVLPFVLALTG